MRYLLSVIAALALVLVTQAGCFFDSNVQSAAQNQTVMYGGALVPNPQAEALLEEAFSKSTVPWDNESMDRIERSRNAIQAMGEFLKNRIEFDSSLPYYTYKASFEYIQNQYNQLQRELDKRVEIEEALSDEGKVIYYYVKRDINERLSLQQMKIAAAEKSINDKASEDSIEEMKAIFTAVKPLIDMVL